MKSVCENTGKLVSESRKVRKPLMEKKRRARINDSLESLKQILLDSKASLKGSSEKKNGQRTAKLEKADILEMTVRYVQHLQSKLNNQNVKCENNEEIAIRPADSSSETIKMGVTLIPTKLSNGEIVFVVPANLKSNQETTSPSEFGAKNTESVWRPW